MMKNPRFTEMQGDLLLYNANRNVTVRMVEDVQLLMTPYMTQGLSVYAQIYEQIITMSQQLGQFNIQQTSEDVYRQAMDSYKSLTSTPLDVIKQQLITYTQNVYQMLKSIMADLYANTKSVSATLGEDTVNAVVNSLKAMEEQLVEFVRLLQTAVEVMQKTLREIQTSENPEVEMQSLVQRIVDQVDIQSAVQSVCAKDEKLCELVQESVNVHRELMDKYLVV